MAATSTEFTNDAPGENEGSSDGQSLKRSSPSSDIIYDEFHKRFKSDIDEIHDAIKNLEPDHQLEFWKKMIQNHPFNLKQMRSIQDLLSCRMRMDIISAVPYHLASYIMSFLNAEDLCKAAQVCRSWRVICNDSFLWREKCNTEKLLDDQHTLEVLFRDNIKQVIQSHTNRPTRKIYKSVAVPGPVFRAAYLKHINVLRNWRTRNLDLPDIPPDQPAIYHSQVHPNIPGRQYYLEESEPYYDFIQIRPSIPMSQLLSCSAGNQYGSSNLYNSSIKKSKLRLLCHGVNVITSLLYRALSKLIVTGSDDQIINVWDSETGQNLARLAGHTGGVWSLALTDDEYVISGSTDRTVRVWQARNGTPVHTLYGHLTTVRCLATENGTIVSGSRDATLRVWDLESGHCKQVLIGHRAAIRCVQIRNGLIVSGAYDSLVMLWHADTGECLRTFTGHQYRIYCLQFDGKTIVSSDIGVIDNRPNLSVGSTIRVWDAETGKLRHELKGHKKLVSDLVLNGDLLASANTDSLCKLWDLKTGRCLKTLGLNDIFNRHTGACTSVAFNQRHVMTSSDDGTVKLWDTKTGLFIRNLVQVAPASIYRIQASCTKLICAVGAGKHFDPIDTQLLILDFDDIK